MGAIGKVTHAITATLGKVLDAVGLKKLFGRKVAHDPHKKMAFEAAKRASAHKEEASAKKGRVSSGLKEQAIKPRPHVQEGGYKVLLPELIALKEKFIPLQQRLTDVKLSPREGEGQGQNATRVPSPQAKALHDLKSEARNKLNQLMKDHQSAEVLVLVTEGQREKTILLQEKLDEFNLTIQELEGTIEEIKNTEREIKDF